MAPLIALLAQQGLSLLGNALMAKGKAVIEEKLGVDIESAVQTPDGLIRLKELELQHEAELNAFVLAQREQELQADKLAHENTASARDMNARIQDSRHASTLAKNAAYVLDYIVVAATIGLIALLMFKAVPLENKEIAFAMLGSLLTLCGTIINFHRGSSAGSKAKSELLELKQ